MTQPVETKAAPFSGHALTPRMIAMGITGMLNYGEGWQAGFEKYGGLLFDIPPPVAEWLLEQDA